ncbi:MAG: 30S ribosomal protein S9 [Candidatus Kariarchaeaceae archaeon]|jgi:small subunit ribosomal protein S9
MADKIILTSGKRRTAIARARFLKPKNNENAIIRINGVPIDKIEPKFARNRIMEPLILAKNHYNNELNVKIRVRGGGVVSRAEAVRIALARGILKYLGLNEVRQIFDDYDRTMISGDVRRTEAKKFGGPGARARFQKSYR